MRRILVGGIFFGLTCFFAVVGYVIAGWSILDAIYMVTITVFGVGYGETKPLDSPALKVFTMGVIVAGCSSGIYTVGGFVQMLAEGEINRVLGTRRMSKGIEKLTGHVLICGYGRVGQMLARDLVAAHTPFVVIDTNEKRVHQAQAAGFLALLGSASEEETLLAAGITRARVLATVLPDDSINVFITLTARELNPEVMIIARAEDPSTEKKLRRSGATRVVLPALIGATKIAHMITCPSAEELFFESSAKMHLIEELKHLGVALSEIEVSTDSPLAGEVLGNVEIGSGFVLVAIRRADGTLDRNLTPETTLEIGDTLVLLGRGLSSPTLKRRVPADALAPDPA